MAELPRSEQRPQKPVRWPRRALAFVLAFVSENSETFASHSRTSGFRSLTEQLNAIVRPDKPYEASHVRSKFESIWRNSGHNADGTVEPLYQFGVHWATLPGLEQKENVTFQDVRDAIEDLRL
ncbi:hypothetical protein A1O3_03958 [Capronia epimyces CBS 606.96]|uniref:Uncharacterized protein n=1 Tax=Capronia epimyces CBS 606.96 TaxID=1182542 RepID=W9YCN0_9EURO|nr:uncharacterized protein A1O3_03958 [Capronia epimyces CBS 606.96]EXJ87001.1 hypothetical protein A1O3_03958 [Capronia epimyces CBS 606.96]